MPLTVRTRAGCHGEFKSRYRLCHCLHPSILTSMCPHQNVASPSRMSASRTADGQGYSQKPPTHVRSRSKTLTDSLKPWGNLGHRGVGDGMMARRDLSVSSLEDWKSFSLWTVSFKFQPGSTFSRFTLQFV